MRIVIDATAPGIFRLTHTGQDGETTVREMLSRTEVDMLTSMYLDRENKRNRVADRPPFGERVVTVPIPKWMARIWPKP